MSDTSNGRTYFIVFEFVFYLHNDKRSTAFIPPDIKADTPPNEYIPLYE